MKAIILAAGMGKRLRPLTESRPKSLVEVHGKAILEHQLESLAKVGITECVLVVGYLSDVVRRYRGTEFRGIELSYVENERYDETNNLYSLSLARREFGDGIILLEGDLVFETRLLEALLDSPASNGAIADRYQPFMDGTVILPKGRFAGSMILKRDQGPDFDYSRALKTVNIYKLSGDALSNLIAPELTRYVTEGKTGDYYEAVFADLVSRGSLELAIVLTEDRKWAEVDTAADLEYVESIFPAPAVSLR